MDLMINGLLGLVLSWVYNPIKARLKLEGKAAAWLLFSLLLLISIPVTLASGAFTGMQFDPADPGAFLTAVGKAFLILVGAASARYAVTKK